MNTEMSEKATPQILSRSAVQILSQGLDASDILECYALVRPAPLHNAMMSDATMTVHKVGVGIRYRSLTLTEEGEDKDKIREITLEYGPQRMGVSLSQESTPLVQHEGSGGTDVNSTETDYSTAFVTWENEGKVYYTTQIASTGYISAYYMASVTGAVLEKVLEKAVEYPLENIASRGRPRRYQPFVVVDGSNPLLPPGYEGDLPPKRKVLLKSSGSSDFLEYMWYSLAELGVSLQPILKPPTYEVQLVSTGVEKVKVGPPTWVTQSAATFYEKLYQCIEAKVTGDYSRYAMPTPSPTSNSPLPTPQITDGSTSGAPSTSNFAPTSNAPLPTPQIIDGTTSEAPSSPGQNTTENNLNNGPVRNRKRLLRSEQISMRDARLLDGFIGNDTLADPDERHSAFPPDSKSLDDSNNATGGPLSVIESIAPSAAALPPNSAKKTDVEEAQIAANQAQQAASQAKDAAKTDVDSKAADAAQVAATAAKKAADSSAQAAAAAQSAALMSGDGNAVIGVIAPCFTDPQFGIAEDDGNGTIMAHAYLYMDGSSYYKVNLTYPFVQVVQVDLTLPQPGDFAVPGDNGDFVDWALALFLLCTAIFGLLMLVQQVCGGYVKLFQPLFKFQRWFFNPMHHHDTIQDEIEEQKIAQARQGGGQEYTFGQDAIPISMGGRPGPVSPRTYLNTNFSGQQVKSDNKKEWIPLTSSDEQLDDSESSHEDREIEMIQKPPPMAREHASHHRATSRGSRDSGDSASSFSRSDQMDGSNKDIRIQENELPARFTRDPDFVELPNLKSTSKVAVPVGAKRSVSPPNGSSGSLV